MKNTTTWLLSAAGVALLAPSLQAQVFSYSDEDVLLTIRPNASYNALTTGASSAVVFDLGNASNFYNATPNSTFAVGSASVVNATFGSLANLSIAAFAANNTGADSNTSFRTVFATRPETTLGVQSTPWNDQSSGTLANPASRIASLGSQLNGLGASSGLATLTTTTAAGGNSTIGVSRWLGSGSSGNGNTGNFNSTWQGSQNIENQTGSTFTGASYIRSDLYEVVPGSTSTQSTYLGYFQFNADGSASFTAVPEPQEYAAVVGLALAGFALWRRRSAK